MPVYPGASLALELPAVLPSQAPAGAVLPSYTAPRGVPGPNSLTDLGLHPHGICGHGVLGTSWAWATVPWKSQGAWLSSHAGASLDVGAKAEQHVSSWAFGHQDILQYWTYCHAGVMSLLGARSPVPQGNLAYSLTNNSGSRSP